MKEQSFKYCPHCGHTFSLEIVFNGFKYVIAFTDSIIHQFEHHCPNCKHKITISELLDIVGGS